MVFPMPKVSGFNRLRYTEKGDYEEEFKNAEYGNVIWNDRCAIDGYDFNNNLNLYGFRGPNPSFQKTKGRDCIVFIGDSFAEGIGSSDNDTIWASFSRLIRSQSAEVVNLGVAGIGFSRYVELVRDSQRLMHPDWLFLIVCANDLPTIPFDANAIEAREFRHTNEFVPRIWEVIARRLAGRHIPLFYHRPIEAGDTTGELAPNGMLIAKELGLPEDLDPTVFPMIARGEVNPFIFIYPKLLYPNLTMDYSKQGSIRPYIEEMDRTCREAGTRLCVVYIPCHFTVNPKYLALADARHFARTDGESDWSGPRFRQQQKHLADVTDSLGIAFIDMTNPLIEAERRQIETFWPYDGHCTAAGYQIVADACANLYLENKSKSDRSPIAP
jgi:lysophospholipase L1-like esterase